METQKQSQRRMVGMIEAYRAARKAGKTRMNATIDSFGNVLLNIEQDYCDNYTQEIVIHVLPSVTSQKLIDALAELKTFVEKGNERENIQGTIAMRTTAETLRKQAEEWEKKAAAREEEFAGRIEDLQELIDDAIAEEAKAKAEFEKTVTNVTTDVEKIIAKESTKKNA